MDIGKRLQVEHSRSLTTAIVNYIGTDKKKFKELLDLFFKGEYRITQRASWALGDVAIAQPQLIRPHLSKLIVKLEDKGQHPAITRNIMRMLEKMEIPDDHQSKILDLSFEFLKDESQPIAVRALSITTASRIAKKYPELKNEMLALISDLANIPQSPAIAGRLKNALKELRVG